jgi:beta-ribofuranosylaminobenzene 5'-phosphate synthase
LKLSGKISPDGGLKLVAFPRIHMTLIGMNSSGYRINGGVGFALKNPSIKAIVNPASEFSFLDERSNPLQNSEVKRLRKVIDEVFRLEKFKRNVSVVLSGEIKTHSGFGSGTLIRLMCLEGLFLLNKRKYTAQKLVALSKRGGTSGIGIRTYFHGGLVLDIGHKKGAVVPSSVAERDTRYSLLLASSPMPNWKIGICMPHYINSLSGKKERTFFKKVLPVANSAVNKTLYHSVYGIFGAVKENDKDGFHKAVNEIQKCTWKKSERKLYGKPLKRLEKVLFESGAKCVGMTSLGPILYFLADDVNSVIKKAEAILKNKPCTFIVTEPTNRGRNIENC